MITTQKGNVVGRDQIGRDKIENNYNFNSGLSLGCDDLALLYEKFKSESQNSQPSSSFTEKLQHYLNVGTNRDVRGLEKKLEDADRLDQLDIAQELKEKAFKSIMRRQSSSAAQGIFTFILDELHTNFMLTVTPVIQQGGSRLAVDQAILQAVEQTRVILGENIFEITKKDILGFIYFLAGNCHVRWDKC